MHTKLLLADDEPLVLVGLQSILNWEAYDMEIVGVAHNGEEALQLIDEKKPDLAIVDIKMPVKNGLEVMQACREKGGSLPLFILLTSYEEFGYAKEALHLQAVDYLVKLELTPDSLLHAVQRARQRLDAMQTAEQKAEPPAADDLSTFYERFFMKLYHNLFESREQYALQRRELGIDFSFAAYTVCYCEILTDDTRRSWEKKTQLYSSTIRMVQETIHRYMACYITSLDLQHFNITFCLSEQEVPAYREHLAKILQKATEVVQSYFNVGLSCRIGCLVKDPFAICESYATARRISLAGESGGVSFYNPHTDSAVESFDFSSCRSEIRSAFEQLDLDTLSTLLTQIADSLDLHPIQYAGALDTASNLLYMSISLLPEGEAMLNRIFPGEEGCRCLYACRTVPDVTDWIRTLRAGLSLQLRQNRQNYKAMTVQKVMQYIRAHLDRKLSLNEVSAVFGFSANYLSQLFTKETGHSFVEFITHEKIAAAKEMMRHGTYKIYEIASKLGFESAFYFSKVFKKVEGCSPREYMQTKLCALSEPAEAPKND
ncbi:MULTISPECIES: response regulator transcription factor [Caproicibacterium]|uniref:Stage 0 sporulation protein A homolog n=1 Tax=Caproicibacterium argilliputei TaxID=3030016 RepID=A0AA97D9K1_9FIRM|nr:response regulator [Caproicibacterium argilliputei]WOC33125.1 response regulator [Caproicibacterium argilliputei]